MVNLITTKPFVLFCFGIANPLPLFKEAVSAPNIFLRLSCVLITSLSYAFLSLISNKLTIWLLLTTFVILSITNPFLLCIAMLDEVVTNSLHNTCVSFILFCAISSTTLWKAFHLMRIPFLITLLNLRMQIANILLWMMMQLMLHMVLLCLQQQQIISNFKFQMKTQSFP